MSLKNCSVKKQQHTYIQAICSSYRVLQSWFPSSWFPSPAFLKKYLFVFVLWVVSHMVLCAPRVCSVHRDQKKELDPRNWSYRWLWTALRTLLPNPSPMRKAAWDLNLWALSQNECFVSCSICQFGLFLDLLKTCFLSFCFVCFLLLASLLLLSGISLPLSFFFFPYPYFNHQIYLEVQNSCPMPPSWVYNLQSSIYNPGKRSPVFASVAHLDMNGHLIVHAPSINSTALQYG